MAKVVEVVSLKEPNDLSIVNDIWGNTLAVGLSGSIISNTSLNFKYVSQLVVKDKDIEEINLGLFSYPPRPLDQSGFQEGYGAFSPSNILRSYMWNDPNIYQTAGFVESPSSVKPNIKTAHIQYDITGGFSFNPNLQVNGIEVISGGNSYLGFTFSAGTTNFFVDLAQIYVLSTNPLLSGPHQVNGSTTSNFITTYTPFTQSMTIGTDVALITSYYQSDITIFNKTGFDGVLDYVDYNQSIFNTTDKLIVDNLVSSGDVKFLSSYDNYETLPTWQYIDFEGNFNLLSKCRKIPNNTYHTLSAFLDITKMFDDDIRFVICLYNDDTTAQSGMPLYFSPQGSITLSRARYDALIGQRNLDVNGLWDGNAKYMAVWLESYTTGDIYSEVRFFEFTDLCSIYTPITFMYSNKYGAFDYITFTQDTKQVDSITRNEYKQELNWGEVTGSGVNVSPVVGSRGRNILSQRISETYTANSNWLSEYEYTILSEFVESSDVYIILDKDPVQNNIVIPIVITDTTYDFKTSFRDGIFNLTINYKLANDRMSQRQ